MKAQFATIEAAFALMLITSAVSFVSWQMSQSSMNLDASRKETLREIAAYDLLNQLARNRSANDCIADLYAGQNIGCVSYLEDIYQNTLGHERVELSLNAVSEGLAGNSTQRCMSFRIQKLNTTKEVCVLIKSR